MVKKDSLWNWVKYTKKSSRVSSIWLNGNKKQSKCLQSFARKENEGGDGKVKRKLLSGKKNIILLSFCGCCVMEKHSRTAQIHFFPFYFVVLQLFVCDIRKSLWSSLLTNFPSSRFISLLTFARMCRFACRRFLVLHFCWFKFHVWKCRDDVKEIKRNHQCEALTWHAPHHIEAFMEICLLSRIYIWIWLKWLRSRFSLIYLYRYNIICCIFVSTFFCYQNLFLYSFLCCKLYVM